MGINLHSIITDLCTPGRILAFGDETDLTFEPTPTMVGNLHLYGGIILRSETYGPLAHTLTTYLADIGQLEFHGTEIVNPRRNRLGNRWVMPRARRRYVTSAPPSRKAGRSLSMRASARLNMPRCFGRLVELSLRKIIRQL
jgi:hypothetical protein